MPEEMPTRDAGCETLPTPRLRTAPSPAQPRSGWGGFPQTPQAPPPPPTLCSPGPPAGSIIPPPGGAPHGRTDRRGGGSDLGGCRQRVRAGGTRLPKCGTERDPESVAGGSEWELRAFSFFFLLGCFFPPDFVMFLARHRAAHQTLRSGCGAAASVTGAIPVRL